MLSLEMATQAFAIDPVSMTLGYPNSIPKLRSQKPTGLPPAKRNSERICCVNFNRRALGKNVLTDILRFFFNWAEKWLTFYI